ncbi:unnamed protein product [Closterium sp. NIES-53]
MSTYKLTDGLYISQLEEKLNHICMGKQESATDHCMGKQESATDHCKRARLILANMRMAGVDSSTASYITHFIMELPSGYNLMRRMLAMPSARESLNEKTLNHIIKDEAMHEVEKSTELLPQANYVASTKQGHQQGQRRRSGRSGSGGGKLSKDVDWTKSRKEKEASKKMTSARRGLVLNGRRRGADAVPGRGIVARLGEAGKQVLDPDVIYVLGVQANMLSAGQLKDSGVKL